MPCRFQCTYCQDTLAVGEHLVGRTIRCPLCETKLKVPEIDPDRALLDVELSEQLDCFKLSDWDRACAKKVLQLEMAPPAALHQAIVMARKAARKGGRIALNELLLQQGIIDRSGNLVLCELVKGAAAKKKAEKLTECPNCFATIAAAAKGCKFCGQKLGDLLVYDMCPNCKEEQPPGHPLCRKCGADMQTGLLPGVKLPRCPKCDRKIKGDFNICPSCRTRLDRSRRSVRLEEKAKAWKNWISRHALYLMGGVGLVVSLYVYSNWDDLRHSLSVSFFGESLAALEERLELFKTALRYDDMETVTSMLDPEIRRPAGPRERTVILGGAAASGTLERVDRIRVRSKTIDEKTGTATVYVNTTGAFDLKSIKLKSVNSSGDLEKHARKLVGSRALSAEVAWKWVRRDGVWYYRAPLPQARK